MNYRGIIIEESLCDASVLNEVKIISTKVDPIQEKHKTPWLKQWTLHTVEIVEDKIDEVTKKVSEALDRNYWYADYKNDKYHYIIYKDKVFKVDRANPVLYKDAKEYGIALGIPEYQVDFAPTDTVWER
ncbi:MAG: hypothetical protein AAB691_04315 [Patescibacteria group bacterium]